jgi:hypothetical protein
MAHERWRHADRCDESARRRDAAQRAGELRRALLARSDVLVRTMTGKLLTYATGRALAYYDMPAVRAIAGDAAKEQQSVLVARAGNREERSVSETHEAARGYAVDVRSIRRARASSRAETTMSFITKKHLPRRTVLRGLGATIALPLLDSMVAAQTPIRKTAAAAKSRLSCIYVPHGATMDKWTPAAEGKGFEFTGDPAAARAVPRSHHHRLEPRARQRRRGGLGCRRRSRAFCGGVPQRRAARQRRHRRGTTIDQIAAQRIGQDTPLPSLELSIEDVALSCGSGYACAYSNTISWKNATTPLPMENNPQVVFEKLFGDGGNDADRAARRQQSRSLLDSVLGQIATLRNDLPAADRVRLSSTSTTSAKSSAAFRKPTRSSRAI